MRQRLKERNPGNQRGSHETFKSSYDRLFHFPIRPLPYPLTTVGTTRPDHTPRPNSFMGTSRLCGHAGLCAAKAWGSNNFLKHVGAMKFECSVKCSEGACGASEVPRFQVCMSGIGKNAYVCSNMFGSTNI